MGMLITENVWACCTELQISRFINDVHQNYKRMINKSDREILVFKFLVRRCSIRAVELFNGENDLHNCRKCI